MSIGVTVAQAPLGRRHLSVVPGAAGGRLGRTHVEAKSAQLTESKTETLKSVGTALDVLDCFAADTELGVSDIARRLGIAKSTAHRLLTTLCSRGITSKNPKTGMYRLGLRLYELGTLAQSRVALRRSALPLLEELHRVTGRAVLLAVTEDTDVVFVEQLGSVPGVPALGEGQRRYPIAATSAGLVIAAFNDDVAAAAREDGFSTTADGAIRSDADFARALHDARRQTMATSVEPGRRGTMSIAVPIRDLNGIAYAAVVIVGPTETIVPVCARLAALLTTVAARIQRSLKSPGAGATASGQPVARPPAARRIVQPLG